jgi:oligopeptide/dipeptide ABC transporter ATP-binding protein
LPSHPDERREEIILPGEVPSPLNPPAGCRFHPRCPHAMAICVAAVPPGAQVADSHVSACWLHATGLTTAQSQPLGYPLGQPPLSQPLAQPLSQPLSAQTARAQPPSIRSAGQPDAPSSSATEGGEET